jgi:hypothetical protein
VWIIKEPGTARATEVFGRIETALDVAEQNLEQVKASLTRASEHLDSVRQEQKKRAPEPQRNKGVQRRLARTVQRKVGPELGNAQKKLSTVAEATVVINTVLEDMGKVPFVATSDLDVEQLTKLNSRLADLGREAWELSRLLGEPKPDSEAASHQMSLIDRILQVLPEVIAEFKQRLNQARQRTEELKSRTLPRITPAAILISVVCFWIALSQISLMSRAWSWWKHSRHDNSLASPA